MNYPTPTTAKEMYEILEQIYYDYRLKIDAYEDAGLKDLVLERMSFTEKSDEELQSDARNLVYPWYNEEYSKAKTDVNVRIETLKTSKENLIAEGEKLKENLNEEVSLSKETVIKQSIKNGYKNSDITLQKIAELEEYRLEKLAKIEEQTLAQIAKVDGEITVLVQYRESLEEEYEGYFDKKIQAKYLELKEEQEKTKREVFKYNNGLEEKEKRSKNANVSANASLKLRYLEIRSQSYSKEELVDMGYYNDVINCVCGYYETIEDASQAYKSFLADTRVLIYLEDYYGNVLTLLRSKAGG